MLASPPHGWNVRLHVGPLLRGALQRDDAEGNRARPMSSAVLSSTAPAIPMATASQISWSDHRRSECVYFFGTTGSFAPSAPSVVSQATPPPRVSDVVWRRLATSTATDSRTSRFQISTVPRPASSSTRAAESWPVTPLGPSDADYFITGDSTYAGSAFGLSIARIGDFNGDGTDDFAFGAQQFKNGTNFVGRVVIVLGKAGFGSIGLPDTTNTITIDGDSTLTIPCSEVAFWASGIFIPGQLLPEPPSWFHHPASRIPQTAVLGASMRSTVSPVRAASLRSPARTI